jgi:PleD family two-component response regulator
MPDLPKLSRPAFVLVVSERPQMRDAIAHLLADDAYVLLPAPSRRAVQAWLWDVPADVVLVDGAFEDGYGLTIFADLERDPRVSRWAPRFVVHDGPVPSDRVMQGLTAGAWDVLQLPLDAVALRLRLHSMVRAKLEADAAREEASIDELTGVYTWRGLVGRIEEIGSLASRHRRPVACVAFGPNPDRTAAAEVDVQALRAMADEMARVGRTSVRHSDLIGLAGTPTDFIVVAPDTNVAGAGVLAHRLADTMNALEPGRGEEGGTRAGYYGVDDMLAAGIQPVDLLLRATHALYTAQAGRVRDAVRFYEPDD